MEGGHRLVELGAGVTNVSVFAGGMLAGLKSLPIGASDITDAMKVAATHAIAELARQEVTEDAGFDGRGTRFGRDYLIPKPFDRRLLPIVAAAVAKAGLDEGIARTSVHLDTYRQSLRQSAALL